MTPSPVDNRHRHVVVEEELALHRLEKSNAPEAAKENTRAGLQWLRRSIMNNQAYYLAELYEERLVATDSDLVTRGVLPDATDAIETAMKSADEAVRHVRNDGAVDAIQRLRFEETRLYVRYRMGAVDERDELRRDIEALLEEARQMAGFGDTDLVSWAAGRRRVYEPLFKG